MIYDCVSQTSINKYKRTSHDTTTGLHTYVGIGWIPSRYIFLHRQRIQFCKNNHYTSISLLGFQRTRGPSISRSTSTIRSWRAAASSFVLSSNCGSFSRANQSIKSSSMALHLAASRASCRCSNWADFFLRCLAAVPNNHAKNPANSRDSEVTGIRLFTSSPSPDQSGDDCQGRLPLGASRCWGLSTGDGLAMVLPSQSSDGSFLLGI